MYIGYFRDACMIECPIRSPTDQNIQLTRTIGRLLNDPTTYRKFGEGFSVSLQH